MKSQIMVGMIRCFIAEQEIVMFLSGDYNWPDKWYCPKFCVNGNRIQL